MSHGDFSNSSTADCANADQARPASSQASAPAVRFMRPSVSALREADNGTLDLDEELPQLGLQHLAVVVLRQRLDEAVFARTLEASDVVEAQPIQLLAGYFLRENDKGTPSSPHSACG